MWDENKMKILENSFSQRLQSSSSQENSLKSLSRNNELTYWPNQQLPIDSDKRVMQRSMTKGDAYKINQIPIKPPIKVEENYSLPRQFNPCYQKNLYCSPNNHQNKHLTSQITRPSYQINNSLSSFNPQINVSSSSLNSPSKTLIQRRLNSSSRKSIDHNQTSLKKLSSNDQPINSYTGTTSFSNLNKALQNQQSAFNNFSFQRNTQRLTEEEQHPNKKQARLQQNVPDNKENEIKTFKSLTHVPQYENYIQYQPQIIIVPKEKVIEKHYVVQNLIDYVPVMKEQVDGYELIPQQVIKHRLQYQLVQQRIVHLPKDKAWLNGSKQKRVSKKKNQQIFNKNENIYLSRNQSENILISNEKRMNNFIDLSLRNQNNRSNSRINKNTYSNQKLKYLPNQINSKNHRQIQQINGLNNNPKNFQQNIVPQTYQNLVSYFINYEPLRRKLDQDPLKKTFHVTSQKG